MIKIQEARTMVQKALDDMAKGLDKVVEDWLDGTVTDIITEAAIEGRHNVVVTYPEGMNEGQKACAIKRLREEGYEVDPFFITTLEIRF